TGFRTDSPIQPCSSFMDLRTASGQNKVSVLISIAEFLEESETVVDLPCSVVRRYSLDECMRLFGDTRQVFETSVRQRGNLTDLEFSPERKLATVLPIDGQGDAVRIELDQMESDMIQGGSHLIDRLSCENGDVDWGRGGHIQCCFAVRINDYLRRITGSISVSGRLDILDLFWYPIEFCFNGVNDIGHKNHPG